MARSKVPFRKGRKVCIFCGQTPVTGEHIWPGWAHPILPNSYGRGSFLATGVRSLRRALVRSNKVQQGSVYKLQIHRVCGSCNSGWMGQAEEGVRSFLEPMLAGDQVTLTASGKAKLTEYLTYKILLLDWLHGQPILKPEVSASFYEHRTMPPNLQINIYNCFEGRWRGQFRSVELPVYLEAEYRDDSPPNTKTFAVGFGNLFVFAIAAERAELNLNVDPRQGMRLWPLVDNAVQWPPEFPITSDEAEFVSNALIRIGDSPDVRNVAITVPLY